MERFTELVGSAIANAESREALARLADEQAALRRVATLIAQAAPPIGGEAEPLFQAVADEVQALLGGSRHSLCQYLVAQMAAPTFTVAAYQERNSRFFAGQTAIPRRLVFARAFTNVAAHTLRIVALSTKRIDIDEA